MFDLPRISEYFSFLANHPLASAILRVGGARFVILSRGKVYQDKLGLVEGLISEFKGVRKELRCDCGPVH